MNTTNDQPLFSVLIANYNNGQYLQEAIDSVVAQTYAHWEIVIVDDGSTDDSHNIYQHYANDPRFVIAYNGSNCGCGYTKHRCIELAHGLLCGFLDADDVLLYDALEVMVNEHTAKPYVSCIFSRFYLCDSNLRITEKSRKLSLEENQTYFTNGDYTPEHFATFKKEAYLLSAKIDPTNKAGIDQDLYFKLEEVAPIAVVDKFMYMYRLLNNSTSHGENAFNATYWNTIIRHQTCVRRNLSPEIYAIKPLNAYINYHASQEANKVRNSHAYLIGKHILKPFSFLRRFIHSE